MSQIFLSETVRSLEMEALETCHVVTVSHIWTVYRPFYRYGGHIKLIRFKEYYRMPRGHEHISFVFSGAFRDIFS